MGFLAWLHPPWGAGDRNFTAGHPMRGSSAVKRSCCCMLLTLRLVLFDSETVLSQASSSQAFSIQKGGEPLGSSQFCLGLSRPEAS